MKKLLALCLSILMIVSLVPVVSAEDVIPTVSATGEVYFEAEDYLSVNVYATEETTEPEVVELASSTIKSDASFHGGKRVQGGAYGNYKGEISIPFSVETSGTYYVTFRTIAQQIYRVSNPTLSIDGTPVMVAPTTSKSDSEAWITLEFPVKLEAGDNKTLTFTGYKATSNPNVYMYWDYIRISSTREATQIAEKGTTKIEVEEFPILEAERIVDDASVFETYKTDGTGYSSLKDTLKTSDSTSTKNLFWHKNITVAKDGLYTIDFNMIGNGAYTSSLSALVDDVEVIKSASSDPDNCSSNVVTVPLTAGTHKLTIKSLKAESYSINNRFQADYVSVSPNMSDVELSATGETKIEAENYNQATRYVNSTEETIFVSGTITTDETDTSLTYLTVAGQVSGGHVQTWSVPVIAPEEGYYNISFRLKDNNGYEGHVSTLLNGETLQTIGEKSGEWNTYTYFTKLNKGENTIAVSSHRYTGVNAKLTVDYVILKPVYFEASTKVPTTIQAEEYPFIEKYVNDVLTETKQVIPTANDNYGATVINENQYGVDGASSIWQVKVNVKTEGLYKIDYRTILNGKYTSNLYAGVNGNYSTAVNGSDAGGNGESGLTTTSVEAYLLKGENTISVKAVKQGAQCILTVDYITLEYIGSSVTVPATGEVYIEAENYRYVKTYATEDAQTPEIKNLPDANIISDSAYHGGASVQGGAYGNYKGEISIPFSVETSGTYYVSFRTIAQQIHRVSNPTLSIDGTPVMVAPSTSKAQEVWITLEFPVELEAGDNKTLTFTGYKATSNPNVYMYWDYIRISNVREATQIAEKGTTKIEVEEFPVLEAERIVDNVSVFETYKTDGTGYSSIIDTLKTGDSTSTENLFWHKNITVAKDGLYTIDFSVKGDGLHTSTMFGLIDGKRVMDATGDENTCNSNIVEVPLTAGTHTITIQSLNAANHQTNNRFHADYVSVTPIEEVFEQLSATNAVVIEAEKYEIKNLNGDTWTIIDADIITGDYSGGSYIDSKYTTAGGTNYLDIKVNAPETRYYKISAKIQHITAESAYGLYIDNKKAANLTLVEDASNWVEPYAYVELSEGEHAISLRSMGKYGHRRLVADCITVSPENYVSDAKVSISGDSVTYIEAENYNICRSDIDGLNVYTTIPGDKFVNYEGAHGEGDVNSVRWNAYGSPYVAVDIPITIETSGMYKIDYNSAASGGYTGTQDLYLDGEIFVEGMKFSNTAADEFVNTYGYDKYLEAGDYTLTIKSTKTTANLNCYYYNDYVAFIPVEYVTDNGNGSYDVTVVYDEPITTESLVVAAYNKENKLIGTAIGSANNETRVSIEITVPDYETIRSIRTYAWDNFVNCEPLSERIDVNYQPVDTDPFAGDDEINIVYIGGSLTQGSGSTFGGWVGLASEYFKNKFGADRVVNHNVGIGGTTSQYGMFRFAQDVLSKNPDMVFIEFVLNDGGNSDARGASMETMIRTLLELDDVPYVNFVYTKYPGSSHIVPHNHTQVARHYGIPEIYVKGSYVDDETEETYYRPTDRVHPNDTGYRAWYAEIEKCLVTDRYYQKPVAQNKAVFEDSGVLFASALDKFTFEKSGNWTEDTTYNRLYSSTAGDSVSFSFNGNAIAFIISGNSTYGKYNITIDGVDKGTFVGTSTGWDQMGQFFTDLSKGDHEVTITLVDRTLTNAEKGTYDVPGTFFCIEDIFVGNLIG